jgi:outer membrane protein assembly factor BamB
MRMQRGVMPVSLLAAMVWLLVPAAGSAQVVLGTQQIQPQADSNAAGRAESFRTTAAASGALTSLTIYVDTGSTATRLIAGLYSDNGGKPGTLLTQGSLTSPVAAQWNTVTVPSVNVTAGTVYWISILGPVNAGTLRFRSNHTGTRAETSSQSTLTTLPATWTTGTVYGDSPLAAYGSGSTSSQPILSVTPSSLSFAYTVGGTAPGAKSLSVSNTGTGTLTFTAGGNATWLGVTPASGTAPATEQVTAQVSGLAPGTYTGQVSVTATGAQGSPATVPVTLTVSPAPAPSLSVTPSSLSFSYTVGNPAPAPATLNVTNTGGGTLTFTAAVDATWLAVSPSGGTAPQAEQVTALVSGLAPGTYNGHVTVTPGAGQGSPAVIPVTLTVSPAPAPVLSVTPSSLSFSYTVGNPAPAPATLNVNNTGGGTLTFTAAVDATWLAVSPSGGTAPQAEQVTALVSGLTPGTYDGHVTVTPGAGQGSPAVVPATLTVQPAATTTTDWPMVSRDPSRSGYAANDTTINKTNVTTLGMLWAASVDGKIVAQPLYLAGVQIAGGTHDVLIVATAFNSLYALDATTGAALWRRNFGADFGGCQPPGGSGIRSAPVIDRTTNRIYVAIDDGTLHTVSLLDGSDLVAPLTLIDLPLTNKVRGGLNLFGTNLYLASGSGGCDAPPWRGRIFRVDVSGAAPVLVTTFDVIPGITGDNRGGGIWGYGGVTVDPATGYVYAATGADKDGGYTPYGVRMLSLTSDLVLQGSYEPPHPATYPCAGAPCDVDFGATPLVFQPVGCPTMVAAGNKNGGFYVLRATDLAASAPPQQAIQLNQANDWLGSGGVGGIPAYWPAGRMVFVTQAGPGVTGVAGGIVALAVQAAPLCTLQVAWSSPLPDLGVAMSAPTVVGDVVLVGEGGSGRVHAYDAATGTELWNTGGIISGNTLAAPSVGGGKVFVGSWNGSSSAAAGTVRAFAPGAGSGQCGGTPPAVLFGTQTLGNQVDSNTLGGAEAFQTTGAGCGTVNAITVYLDATSTATKVTVGLYADGNGHPSALLGQGSSTQLTPGAWNRIPISSVDVTTGTPYWIAILGTQSGTPHFRDSKGGCRSETHSAGGLTSLPQTWSTNQVYDDCPLSAYGSQ